MEQRATKVRRTAKAGTVNGFPNRFAGPYSTGAVSIIPVKKYWPSGIFCTPLPGSHLSNTCWNGKQQAIFQTNQIIPKMKKAYLYIRTATREVAEESGSLFYQEKQLREYCGENNLTVAGVFSDIGSGATFERPGFNKLLESISANSGGKKLLLFRTWDRFSRNPAGAIEMIAHLKGLNVKVRAVEKPVWPLLGKILKNNKTA
jgi:predicted site-specific integrase-resolvase